MYVLTGYRGRNTADPTEHIFGFDFPARSFFFEILNKLLINDIEATSGNRNTFLFILKWEVLKMATLMTLMTLNGFNLFSFRSSPTAVCCCKCKLSVK